MIAAILAQDYPFVFTTMKVVRKGVVMSILKANPEIFSVVEIDISVLQDPLFAFQAQTHQCPARE